MNCFFVCSLLPQEVVGFHLILGRALGDLLLQFVVLSEVCIGESSPFIFADLPPFGLPLRFGLFDSFVVL